MKTCVFTNGYWHLCSNRNAIHSLPGRVNWHRCGTIMNINYIGRLYSWEKTIEAPPRAGTNAAARKRARRARLWPLMRQNSTKIPWIMEFMGKSHIYIYIDMCVYIYIHHTYIYIYIYMYIYTSYDVMLYMSMCIYILRVYMYMFHIAVKSWSYRSDAADQPNTLPRDQVLSGEMSRKCFPTSWGKETKVYPLVN